MVLSEKKGLEFDAWIVSHSPIQAQKLHALGYIALSWSQCERWLNYMFTALLERGEPISWLISNDMPIPSLFDKIVMMAEAAEISADKLDVLKNARTYFNICRMNRNQFMHFQLNMRSDAPDAEFPDMQIVRKKGPRTESIPIPDDLATVRRVAEEIDALRLRLMDLSALLHKGIRDDERHAWPAKLPEPENLWKPGRPAKQ